MKKKFICLLLLLFTCSMYGCTSISKHKAPDNLEISSDFDINSETELEAAIHSGGDQLIHYMSENYIIPLYNGHMLNTNSSFEEYTSDQLLLFYFCNNLSGNSEYYASKESVETYLSNFFDVDFFKLEQDASNESTLYNYSMENQTYDLTTFSDYDGNSSHGIIVDDVRYNEQSHNVIVVYSYISDFDNENEARTYKEATFKIEDSKLKYVCNKNVGD